MPTACSGLFDERGKTGASGTPRREDPGAVGGQRDDAAPVVALDEAGPDDVGEQSDGLV